MRIEIAGTFLPGSCQDGREAVVAFTFNTDRPLDYIISADMQFLVKGKTGQLSGDEATAARNEIGYSVVGGANYYGISIRGFTDELAAMHQSLSGCATLYDWDEAVITTLTLVDRTRGTIMVSGDWPFVPGALPDEIESADPFCPAVRTRFQGPAIDQSYLPGLTAQFERLLRETRLNTRSPMSR